MKAKPVQIIEFEDNAKVKFNKEVLEEILNQENVKDLPIVILSIVGAYRKGKSFLLSWVIRYLLANHNKVQKKGFSISQFLNLMVMAY